MTLSLVDAMAAFSPPLPLAVAYSGGADSTALLLACAEKWPGQVVAMHVHHGLQAAGDDFEQHCRMFCAQMGVPLWVQHVDARHQPGASPEAAARDARYKAFEALALDGRAWIAIKNIALAQHADDQVETLLLALSRGSGLAGLSAMPALRVRNGLGYHRPFLSVRAQDIRAWLAARGAAWIEDPSNGDERFTRNKIRAQLLPVLEAVFPQFRDTFARSAAHAAQGHGLLLEMAAQDFLDMNRQPVIKLLQRLNTDRQAHVLRYWLEAMHHVVPTAAQLAELQRQIGACITRGHQIRIKVGAGYVRRLGVILDWYNPKDLL